MKKILALLLALAVIFALCAACGSKAEAPAAEEAAPAAEAAAEAAEVAGAEAAPAAEGDASAEPSEEGSGEPVAELYPADGYDKTFEGYKEYAIDALRQDEHAPAEIVETTVESINAAEDGNDDAFAMLIYQGLILSYEDFIG